MNIVIGYDGKEGSEPVLNLAAEHAKAFAATVYIVTSMVGGRDVTRQVFVNAERELAIAETALKEKQIPCIPKLLVRGLEPGEDLVQFAKEIGADELIVGIRKKSKVSKLLLGSTAQYVILEAPCPVVTVK